MPDPIQRVVAAILAVISLPLVAVIGAAVQLESPGPSIHRATRMGTGGRTFTCYKLRSMLVGGQAGPAVTVRQDTRVTRVGRTIRRTHLDELPQLWNVVKGDMRLVGPRPEDPRYVDLTDPLHHEVFTATPGITGLSQLVFDDEASLLDEGDLDRSYREVLTKKLAVDSVYLARRSTRLDLWIIGRTLQTVFGLRETTLAEIESWQ